MPEHVTRRLLKNTVGMTDERRQRDAMRLLVHEQWAEVDRQQAAGLRADLADGARRAIADQLLHEIADDPILWRAAMKPDEHGLNMVDSIRERCAPYDDEGLDPHAGQQRNEDSLKVVLANRLNVDLHNREIAPDKYESAMTELGFTQPAQPAEEIAASDSVEAHAGDYSPQEMADFVAQRESETS